MTTVHVTQADIDGGKPGDACQCPIARAMTREGFHQAEVEAYRVQWVELDGTRRCVPPPIGVREFVINFDHPARRYDVGPFSFEVSP